MGGIPYQSQGCTACRKRKVKCDLGSPQCMRCIKRRISCPGYEKGRFILYQDANAASEGGRQQPLMLSPVMPASSTYRSQIFSKFLESSFPLEIVSSDEIDILPSLIVNISTRPVKSEMLERALAAIAYTCLNCYLTKFKPRI
ncbi:uncharacterized protein N7469_000033 [Penicillium citrinum]|uniref:Zn(2)-C6 fungal-type domain-containing protein n=1 Tax=Penicillium citrinum TaxID=5077 RepID=A0A9W9TUB8_PENCI|nr:uncharacterized protein N7469_000033 [Penicillium citrinum]KAJ5241706.1 hypothetical protein N7469_000033 [Penicillium citrinum]